MTILDWTHIKHFRASEAWGDYEKMDFTFVRELDRLRNYVNVPIIIKYGTQGAHTEASIHYLGFAADIIIPKMKLLDAWIEAGRFNFTGIGFYPLWNNKHGGLHLERLDTQDWKRKLWMGIGTSQENMKYLEMNEGNLHDHYKITP